MEFVGKHLKKSRLKKNIDIKSVAKELNINQNLTILEERVKFKEIMR